MTYQPTTLPPPPALGPPALDRPAPALPPTLLRMTDPAPGGTLAVLPDLGGNLLYARPLVGALRGVAGCVGLRLDRDLLAGLDGVSVAALGRRFAADLAAAGLPAPLHLVGFSFAGYVAFETARGLADLGRPAANLWLIDTAVSRKLPGRPALRRPLAEAAYALRFAWSNRQRLLPGGADPHVLHRYGHVRMDLGRHPEGHRPIIRGLYRAMVDYRPEPWPEGRAVLVRARDERHRWGIPSDLGWRRLVPGCAVVEVAGDHLTVLRGAEGGAAVAAVLRGAFGATPDGGGG